jgi:hypothetical protein
VNLSKLNVRNLALVATAAFTSLTAHAGEVLVRTAGRVFRADVNATSSELSVMNETQILDLLKDAHYQDLGAALDGMLADSVKNARVEGTDMTWTEAAELSWTEAASRVEGPWTERK